MKKIVIFLVSLLFLTSAQSSSSEATADSIDYVSGGGKNLVNVQLINPVKQAKRMVVFLHGDVSRGGNADYFKKRISHYKLDKDTMSVVLMRPGYCSSTGCSDGNTNNRRDHYTEENITMVAKAIDDLKVRYQPQSTVIVGHSGGSAIAGVLMGMYPNTADGAVLLACPCDIPRWRKMKGKSAWPNSLSATDYIKDLSPNARIHLLVGSSDHNTKPILSEEYTTKASSSHVTYQVLDGVDHRGVTKQYEAIAAAIGKVLP